MLKKAVNWTYNFFDIRELLYLFFSSGKTLRNLVAVF